MKEGQTLPCSSIVATERFSKHAPRYTEASLVKRLEELGIGRPSLCSNDFNGAEAWLR